jgi:hypothetical protein
MNFQHVLPLCVALLALTVTGLVPLAVSAPQQAPATGNSNVNPEPPPIPAEEIIQRFAQRESEFRRERGNYTYSQTVVVQDGMPGGSLTGKYEMASDIVFTPQGRRYEQVTYAPVSTLQLVQLTPQDMKDLENIQPFVLTTEELPKYNVEYVGRERVDELSTYVFRVAPKKLEKDQRYFQGTVWVDDHDFAIVKTDGKAVPDLKDNLFPRFVTYRENIESDFWFPTYTVADDVLHFQNGDVRMRMTVRYKNYKRFGSTIRLGDSKPVE